MAALFGCIRAIALQKPPLLHTATGVRCVVSPAATALMLFPRGRASSGEVGAPTSDTPGFVSAVTQRVAEALAALVLQRAF